MVSILLLPIEYLSMRDRITPIDDLIGSKGNPEITWPIKCRNLILPKVLNPYQINVGTKREISNLNH